MSRWQIFPGHMGWKAHATWHGLSSPWIWGHVRQTAVRATGCLKMISLVTQPGMAVHPGMSESPWILKTHPVVRWFFVGAVFLGIGLSLLKLFVGVLGWPFWAASLVQAEMCTLLRFLANDRWVFSQGRPTWARLWKYHVANAGGFALWWTTANALQRFDVPYLWAATLAVVCSTLLSLATNFLWVWRRERQAVR